MAPVATTTSIIFALIKSGMETLVLANPGPPGKWPLKRTESIFQCIQDFLQVPGLDKELEIGRHARAACEASLDTPVHRQGRCSRAGTAEVRASEEI